MMSKDKLEVRYSKRLMKSNITTFNSSLQDCWRRLDIGAGLGIRARTVGLIFWHSLISSDWLRLE